jgi:hypothetical protein
MHRRRHSRCSALAFLQHLPAWGRFKFYLRLVGKLRHRERAIPVACVACSPLSDAEYQEDEKTKEYDTRDGTTDGWPDATAIQV